MFIIDNLSVSIIAMPYVMLIVCFGLICIYKYFWACLEYSFVLLNKHLLKRKGISLRVETRTVDDCEDTTNKSVQHTIVFEFTVSKLGDVVCTLGVGGIYVSWNRLVVSKINIKIEILKLSQRYLQKQQADRAPVSHASGKSAVGIVMKNIAFFLFQIVSPCVRVDSLETVVSYLGAPVGPTPADRYGGKPWVVRVGSSGGSAIAGKFAQNKLSIELKGGLVGSCALEGGKEEQFFTLCDVQFCVSEERWEVVVDSVEMELCVESFYSILPTVAPFIELDPADVTRKKSSAVVVSPFSKLHAKIISHAKISLLAKTVGSCSVLVTPVQCEIDSVFSITVEVPQGITIFRDSLLHGQKEVARIPTLSVKGCIMGTDSETGEVRAHVPGLLEFFIPTSHINLVPDGLVFWIRACIMMSAKFSYTKRPWRIGMRNERLRAYFDKELCNIDWTDVPIYTPKIVNIRIKLLFEQSVAISTEFGEQVTTKSSFVDCDLPNRFIGFTATCVNALGKSGRKAALIGSFSGWVPHFSGVLLTDMEQNKLLPESALFPPENCKTDFVYPSRIGPIPVALRFHDISVQFAEDLVMLIGQQLLVSMEDLRRWAIDSGYSAVPFYKPVTIRLSNVRFAPAELAPTVIDVKEFELAIGPTKDCLEFAFLGIKAWVPSSPIVPPILWLKNVQSPALVSIRVRRESPLSSEVRSHYEYSMKPGAWRVMTLTVPAVSGAVAPGMLATVEFVDKVLAVMKICMHPRTPALSSPPSTPSNQPGMAKGLFKTVTVTSEGVCWYVVKPVVRVPLHNRPGGPVVGAKARYEEDILLCNPLRPSSKDNPIIAEILIGKSNMLIKHNVTSKCLASIYVDSEGVTAKVVNPDIISVSTGAVSVDSVDGSNYEISIGINSPVSLLGYRNAIAMFNAYSVIRESVSRALINPLKEVALTVSGGERMGGGQRTFSERGRPTLTDARIHVCFVSGVQFNWAARAGSSLKGNVGPSLSFLIPENKLKCSLVLHALVAGGETSSDVKLPPITDHLLLQWLRSPWAVSKKRDSNADTPSPTEGARNMQSGMSNKIVELLRSADSHQDSSYQAYPAKGGLFELPFYLQAQIQLSDWRVCLGTTASVLGIDSLEIRGHFHNLPTEAEPSPLSRLKLSYWSLLTQNPTVSNLTFDLIPEVHVPILLQLVGSPAELTMDSQTTVLFEDHVVVATIDPHPEEGDMTGDSFLSRLDLGFRVTMLGIAGRAGAWVYGTSKVSLFKEDGGRGNGLLGDSRSGSPSLLSSPSSSADLLVVEIKEFHSAMCSSSTMLEAVQPLHSRVCWGVPEWQPGDSVGGSHVFPFISVKHLIVHLGGTWVGPTAIGATTGGTTSTECSTVFVNIQGGRLWWSASMNRAMRLSLDRSDSFVDLLSRWKTRFTKELDARLGKNPKQKKTIESLIKWLDQVMSGKLQLVLRCADVQINFHTVLAGGADDEGAGGNNNGHTTTPSKSPGDIPKYFRSVVGGPSGGPSASPTPSGIKTTFTRLPCLCATEQTDQSLLLLRKLKGFPIDLDFMHMRSVSWWTEYGHLKKCPLPPLPLVHFFFPVNSKRETTIAGVTFERWLADMAAGGAGVTAGPTSSTSLRPRGSQLLLSSKEALFDLSLERLGVVGSGLAFLMGKGNTPPARPNSPPNKTPTSSSSIRVGFVASFNSLQGSVAPTAMRGLVWLGAPGQNILRPVLTIPKILISLGADLLPLKSASLRLLIPKVSLSADDDAFHLVVDVLRNCVLYRGALIDPGDVIGGKRVASPNGNGASTTPRAAAAVAPSVKRDQTVDSILTALAVADANLPQFFGDISAEYIVESVSINLTHRQRSFIHLELSTIVGKHSFSLSHPHRPMRFSFQLKDVNVLGAGDGSAAMNATRNSPTSSSADYVHSAPAKLNRVIMQSAGGMNTSNSTTDLNTQSMFLLTIRGNDRYITVNNREWHVYDTLYLSTSPLVVDVTQEMIEELYSFIFRESNSLVSNSFNSAGGSNEFASGFFGADSVSGGHTEEVIGNKLLSTRNKARAASAQKHHAQSPLAKTQTSVSVGSATGAAATSSTETTKPTTTNQTSDLIFFKFARFSNIDLIVTYKGKQFSLNQLAITLKYYLKRRKLATWKEFLDEWGTKVGKQAFGSFVKHGFSRKKGLHDIISSKASNMTTNDKDVGKLLFGKYAVGK